MSELISHGPDVTTDALVWITAIDGDGLYGEVGYIVAGESLDTAPSEDALVRVMLLTGEHVGMCPTLYAHETDPMDRGTAQDYMGHIMRLVQPYFNVTIGDPIILTA